MKIWPLGANEVKFTHKMLVSIVPVSEGRKAFLHAAFPGVQGISLKKSNEFKTM